MLRTVLLAKIHRATVKKTLLDYSGSLTIDMNLLEEAGIKPYERIEVYNMSNGQRFATYAIEGERGSGMIGVNGAAARLAYPGDQIIIATFGMIDDKDIDNHKPKILIMDKDNKVEKIL
ncbi:MAG: aspartate 1-decarboxylase [Candidatus Cloacimonetes bacterium]|nr:aspartate 1-decarboxylase [Candidatus Cloacimonadota bacterium]